MAAFLVAAGRSGASRGLTLSARRYASAVSEPAPSTSLVRKYWPIALGAVGVTGGVLTFTDSGRAYAAMMGRAGLTGSVGAAIVADYKWSLYGESRKDDAVWSKVHARSAERLLWLFRSLGGVYIKIGQHMAALEYLLPREYTQTMAALQNDAPQSPFAAVERVIHSEFDKPISEIFATFDPTPIASASLAQVHRATLLDGREVAVKVQHEALKRDAPTDLLAVNSFAKIVRWLFPDFSLDWLAEEVRVGLPKELNFVQEGANADRARVMFAHRKNLVIPEIFWPLTSSRVLIMEFIHGAKVTDLGYLNKHKIDPRLVATTFNDLFGEMIYTRGFVHADPHPGNVYVRSKEPTRSWWNWLFGGKSSNFELVLFDHGLYRELSDDFRLNYAHLWLSIINGDEKGIKHYSKELGAGDLYRLFTAMLTARVYDSVVSTDGSNNNLKKPRSEAETKLMMNTASNYLTDVNTIFGSIPRELLLVLKTNDLARSVENTLLQDGGLRSYAQMARYCVDTIYETEINDESRDWKSRAGAWVDYQRAVFRLWVVDAVLAASSYFKRA